MDEGGTEACSRIDFVFEERGIEALRNFLAIFTKARMWK